MVRYVKNEGRPALGFAVESEESDESSDDEPLSDQPSLATLVSENPGSPPDSQAPFVPKSERRRSSARVSFKEDMAFVDRQGYTRDSENLKMGKTRFYADRSELRGNRLSRNLYIS